MGGVLALTQPISAGIGQQLPLRIANPAAGANVAQSIPGDGLYRLLSLVFTVTLANAGSNRLVTVEYRGADNLPFSVNEATTLQVINTAERYAGSISYSVSDFNTGTDLMFPLDPVFLFPGNTLNVVIAGINASDQISDIRGVWERFPLDSAVLPTMEP